jgi:hypothetical protein
MILSTSRQVEISLVEPMSLIMRRNKINRNTPECQRSFDNLFFLVFDREGYSLAFITQMLEKHRISCIPYHKYPDDAWPEEWFVEQEVVLP